MPRPEGTGDDLRKVTKHLGRRHFLWGAGWFAWGWRALLGVGDRAIAADQTATAKTGAGKGGGLDAIGELLHRKEPTCWVFTGDSITHGALHTLGWRSYTEHFAERVRWELRRMRDIVINTGISGDRTGGLLADLEWRALHLKPDVVSVMLGMNDCSSGPEGRETFRKNLTAIVERIRGGGALPLLHTPNTVYVSAAAICRRMPRSSVTWPQPPERD